MDNSWNSLEITNVIISALTPIIGGIIAWKLARIGKDIENRQWAGRKIIEKRLEIYEKLVPSLNDLYCFFLYISVFEKNSFMLYDELTREKEWEPVDFPPPPGHFAVWESRHQLAIAKCHAQLDGNEKEEDFCALLLQSTGSRSTDEFIELHIFDKITYFNIGKVKFRAKLTRPQDQIALSIAEEKLEKEKVEIEITW